MNIDNIFSIFWIVAGLFFGFGGALWWFFSMRYKNVIYPAAFKIIGFSPGDGSQNVMSGFNISYKLQIVATTIYSGTYKNMPTSYLFFTLNQGDDNFPANYHGVIFETDRDHETLQIYDGKSDFAPAFKWDRKLESDEFNKAFVINAESQQEAFYQLSPGAMQKLLELRTKFILPFNIEFSGKKVLVFGLDESYQPSFNSLTEVLFQKPNETSAETLANNILFALDSYWEIYQATLK